MKREIYPPRDNGNTRFLMQWGFIVAGICTYIYPAMEFALCILDFSCMEEIIMIDY